MGGAPAAPCRPPRSRRAARRRRQTARSARRRPPDRAFSRGGLARRRAIVGRDPHAVVENGESRPLPPPDPRGGTRPGGASAATVARRRPAATSQSCRLARLDLAHRWPRPRAAAVGVVAAGGEVGEGPGGTAPSCLSILGAPRPRPDRSSVALLEHPSSDETEERSETRLAPPSAVPHRAHVPRQRALRRPRCGDAPAAGGHLLQLRKVVAAAAAPPPPPIIRGADEARAVPIAPAVFGGRPG